MFKKFVFLTFFSLSSLAANLSYMLESANNNELLKAKSYDIDSALEFAKEVKSKYLPKVSVDGMYANFALDRLLIEPKDTLRASLIIEALLYDGGARGNNIDMAYKQYNIGSLELEQKKNELSFNIVKLYYAYLALEESTEYKKKNLEYLKANLNRLSKLVKAQLRSKDELEIFKANIALKEIELLEDELKQEELLSNIRVITNKNIIPTKGSIIKYVSSNTASYEEQIASAKLELAKLNKQKEYSQFLPKVFVRNSIGVAKSRYDYSIFAPFDKMVEGKIKENTISNTFIIGFTWDIFNFGASNRALEQARLKTLAANELIVYAKKQNKEEIDLLKKQIRKHELEISANELRYKASKQAFKGIAKKYEAGLISYVEYLNALELEQGAFASLILSKSKYEIAKANLLLKQAIKIDEKVIE